MEDNNSDQRINITRLHDSSKFSLYSKGISLKDKTDAIKRGYYEYFCPDE